MWYCQVAALEECFGVGVTIEYKDCRIVKDVDGSVRRVACHEYGRKDDDGSGGGKKKMNIALLYGPGHHDVFY